MKPLSDTLIHLPCSSCNAVWVRMGKIWRMDHTADCEGRKE